MRAGLSIGLVFPIGCWRQKMEPLREWRKSSVLLHLPLLTLANASFWSLCRNDSLQDRAGTFTPLMYHRPEWTGRKVHRNSTTVTFAKFYNYLIGQMVYRAWYCSGWFLSESKEKNRWQMKENIFVASSFRMFCYRDWLHSDTTASISWSISAFPW